MEAVSESCGTSVVALFYYVGGYETVNENLNAKEKEILLFLGKQYRKHYDVVLPSPEHDFIVVDGEPVDLMQNILQALKLRGYLNTQHFNYEFSLDNITTVLLTEKSLNLFNSERFDLWLGEEQRTA